MTSEEVIALAGVALAVLAGYTAVLAAAGAAVTARREITTAPG